MSDRITMADVAQEAGVSLMTVSRVVNKKGDVSDVTRQRVLEVIRRLDYRPSGIARGLATRRTGTLGLVVPDITNPFFPAIARGVEREAYACGYNVFLCSSDEDPQREASLLKSLEEKRVDGLIVCSSRLDDETLRDSVMHHPAVVLINRSLYEDQVCAVLVDDETGGRLATEFLLQAGHKAIGMIAGPAAFYSGRQRVRGYRLALEKAGVAHADAWVHHCAPTVRDGHHATRGLLAKHRELTALFCYNDLTAVGALRACEELGLPVPDRMAVVGFDDIDLAALVTPSLTTLHVPRYDMGVQAIRMLLNHINGRASSCPKVLLRPELIVRASAPDAVGTGQSPATNLRLPVLPRR